MRLPWKRRQEAPRPNYTAIAVLEHDLFGIQPAPGTTAAAIIGMRRLGPRLAQAGTTPFPAYVGPEFGSGLVGRPSPYLLKPGERVLSPTEWMDAFSGFQ
jgi:hypothetical protein